MKLDIFADSILVAHPALSADGSVLYFVSDKPGGQGGNYIWRAQRAAVYLLIPEKSGKRGSTPREMQTFPFACDNGELYFSSDYHLGMGVSIFSVRWKMRMAIGPSRTWGTR